MQNEICYLSCTFFYINNVKIGDDLILKTDIEGNYVYWFVFHNDHKIARLSKSMAEKLTGLEKLSGFVISSVYVNTYEETKLSDEKNGTSYSSNWTIAKERGYIYLIDFSGFGN